MSPLDSTESEENYMKLLLALFVSLVVSNAFAGTPRKVSVIKAQSLEIDRVKCPPGKMCAAVLRYEIVATYKPVGCADEVEIKAYDAGYVEGTNTRIIELIGLNYSRGKNIRCTHHPLKVRRVGIGSSADVKIVELKKLSDIEGREE